MLRTGHGWVGYEMGTIYLCLAKQHDLGLVAVAALVCLLTAYTTTTLTQRATARDNPHGSRWTVGAGFVAGAGTWATHFVAMLAFNPGIPAEYDVSLTLLSIVIAVSGAVCALAIANGLARWRAWLGGACLGADVAAMHYTGMAAVTFPAVMVWDWNLVACSVALAVALASLAIRMASAERRPLRTLAGTTLLVAAICMIHFAGMGALSLDPIFPEPSLAPVQSTGWLATLVVIVTVMILGAAFAGMRLDRYLARRMITERDSLRALVDATFEGILIHVDGVIADVNNSLLGLLGKARPELIGSPVAALVAPGFSLRSVDAIEATELDLLRSDGTRVPVEILGRSIDYQSRSAEVLAIRDIAERRASQERIHRLAFQDSLTDLPNRRSFRERLKLALERAEPGNRVAVLCLDIDHFAAVNDTFGLPIGDGLLRKVATRAARTVRASDTLCRLGGDEFAVIQADSPQPETVISLCRRLIEHLSPPINVGGRLIPISASIGVAFALEGDTEPDNVLKHAAMALSRAKADGGGRWRFYDADMDAKMQERHRLERDLRQALPLEQFAVHYQPLIEVASGRISGFEALIRWNHPERGAVPPSLFIPLAEELGLIGAIGAWVLRQACAEAATWPYDLSVAVNLSPAQFRNAALADDIRDVLSQAHLAATRLQIEVTESLLLGDEPSVLAILHTLRDLGARIVMDDFGTGYSSLSYLIRYPFDKLKIDQSFVRGLDGRERSSAIISAVTAMGRSLGMTVNAEGVETVEELSALQHQGCDEVQGYFFSAPVPAEEVNRLIDTFGCSNDVFHNLKRA